jgi:hypothetical protein
MSVFIASAEQQLLERHGLASFEALWGMQLDAVDEPNTGRGGWSSVFRLDLDGQGFYLKRQSNYQTYTLRHPLGEPSFSREFRNITRYRKLGIPALQAVFYGDRRVNGERQAILMTRALDGWTDLDTLLARWNEMPAGDRCADVAQGWADPWLFLSQAYFSQGSGWPLSGLPDRSGENPSGDIWQA